MRPLDEAMRRAAATAESAWINSDSYSQRNEWPAVLKAALASLAAAGWVLVPRKATLDMRQAAHEAMFEDPWNGTNEGVGAGIDAAIAAAERAGFRIEAP